MEGQSAFLIGVAPSKVLHTPLDGPTEEYEQNKLQLMRFSPLCALGGQT